MWRSTWRKLALRLGSRYIGTIIRGGVEGIQAQPEYLNRRLFMAFSCLGRHFGVTKEFHPITVRKLAGRDRMPAFTRGVFRLLIATGLADYVLEPANEKKRRVRAALRPALPAVAARYRVSTVPVPLPCTCVSLSIMRPSPLWM